MPTLTTSDGLRLQGQSWPLPAQAARGTVLIVHGLGEHIGRYAVLAAHLNAWGWQAAGFDHRGHGCSDGPRGGLPSDDALLLDLAQAIDATRTALPGPLVLLGHSMGGLVAARFVAEGLQARPAAWYREVDALVLSSPALDPGMNVAQKLLLAVLGPIAPGLAVGNGLKTDWISRDPAVVAAYIADPLVHDRITPRLARFIQGGGALVRGLAPRWKVPTLLLYAGSDRCVAPAGSLAFAAAAPTAVVQAQAFAPLYHEIFNEPEKDTVFAALATWLAALRLGPPSPPGHATQ
jgi:alpha-beta hydrolase superfamily lysophospholipase